MWSRPDRLHQLWTRGSLHERESKQHVRKWYLRRNKPPICYQQSPRPRGLPNVVTDMIQVFHFTVCALLDQGSSLSFVNPYVAMNFDVIHEKLSEPFSVSTPFSQSILAMRVS